jgi:hypothetical protein
MSTQPQAFVAQALAARANIVAAMDEVRALLAECDEDEVSTWTTQLGELTRALRLIDEQVAEHVEPPVSLLSDDKGR